MIPELESFEKRFSADQSCANSVSLCDLISNRKAKMAKVQISDENRHTKRLLTDYYRISFRTLVSGKIVAFYGVADTVW